MESRVLIICKLTPPFIQATVACVSVATLVSLRDVELLFLFIGSPLSLALSLKSQEATILSSLTSVH